MRTELLAISIATETDVVLTRQRARQIAAALGFDQQDQARVAAAVSEIARNAFQYGHAGRALFAIDTTGRNKLCIEIVDQGPGIRDLQSILDGRYRSQTGMGVGVTGARKLVDAFEISTHSERGTRVVLEKYLPAHVQLAPSTGARLAAELMQHRSEGPLEELRHQNQELVQALDEQRRTQSELELLNRELEETNRGVMVLYNELEEKAEALRRSHEAKSQFFSEMNHEVRTPINSIVNLSQLLLNGGVGSDEHERAVGYILKSAKQLSELVDDLLDLAKSEAGKMIVRPASFTVEELFGGLRGMFRPLHTREEVTLVFEDVSQLPPLHSDQGKISQILRNFISNALKFTETGSVHVAATESGSDIVFEVRDTGVGIAPDQHERLFEPFVQLDNARQHKVRGTGLGLSLTRSLSNLLGGQVSVTSALGSGSVFYAYIPRVFAPATSESGRPLYEPPAMDGRRRILIIDDDDAARYALSASLRSASTVIFDASSGADGLRLAREHKPQVIFLDLQMPNMDGYAVLDALKAEPATRAIPVIIHTSRQLDAQAAARLAEATVAVLNKDALTQPQGLLALGDALKKAGLTQDQYAP